MIYRSTNILIVMAIMVSCAKSNIIVQSFKTEQIVHYSQITNNKNIFDYVVYLDKGDKIPVKMTIDSEILDIANEQTNLILKQKVYFRLRIPEGIDSERISTMSEEDKQKLLKKSMLYISSDAKRWAPYTDFKAIEQLFGIKSGSFSIGMGMTKEDGVRMLLYAKTNRI